MVKKRFEFPAFSECPCGEKGFEFPAIFWRPTWKKGGSHFPPFSGGPRGTEECLNFPPFSGGPGGLRPPLEDKVQEMIAGIKRSGFYLFLLARVAASWLAYLCSD